jgi:hypothetical protein
MLSKELRDYLEQKAKDREELKYAYIREQLALRAKRLKDEEGRS